MRAVLEAAPTILYVYDVQEQRSVFQNRRFGELLGHPPSVEHASEWTTFIHPDDANRFPEHREKLKAIRAGETLFWDFRMRDSKDIWRWFQSRDSLLSSDATGKPKLVVGSSSEITEQKDAELRKELLADEMRHRARNLVAIVQAIGRMSRPKNQPEVNKHLDAFMGRMLTPPEHRRHCPVLGYAHSGSGDNRRDDPCAVWERNSVIPHVDKRASRFPARTHRGRAGLGLP